MVWIGRPWQAAVALSLASFGLGGCWYSDELLISQAESAQPVESGKYWYPSDHEAHTYVTIEKIPGGGYLYHEDDRISSLFVVEVSDSWYGLQLSSDGDGAQYSAGRINGDRLEFYYPDCDEELGALEYVARENSDCHITGIEGLIAATQLVAARVADGTITEPASWVKLEEQSEADE